MTERRMPPESEVAAKVVEAIASALELEPEEISLGGNLEDYGAESLDILEILFVLERAFRIRLPRLGLLQLLEAKLGPQSLVDRGEITELGLEILIRMRPEIDPSHFKPGLRIEDANRLITAQSFVRIVLRMIEATMEAHKELLETGCEECGSKKIVEAQRSPEFVCQECGEVCPVPSGDQVLIEDVMALGIVDGV